MEGIHLHSHSDLRNSQSKAIRGGKDIFYFLTLKNGNTFTGERIIFFEDKTEEISNFRVPLMFIGVGVAFVYQICFKDSSLRSIKTKKMRNRDRRNEKLAQIGKQIDSLKKTTDSFRM